MSGDWHVRRPYRRKHITRRWLLSLELLTITTTQTEGEAPLKMDEIDQAVLAVGLYAIALQEKEKRKRKTRKIWTRRWLARRQEKSLYRNLVQELSLEDEEGYRRFMRLNKHQFHEILELVRPAITKQDTNMRKAVTAEERLAITLRYLATGESQSSLGYQFRVSQNLISTFIPEVCSAIFEVLKHSYLKIPRSHEDWKNVARDFFTMWNYPSCVGALDGKRVLIHKPGNTGSEYFDYKGHCSIILLALVDANYKFLYADVGTNGRASDGAVWDKCSLRSAIDNNQVNFPPPETLPLSDKVCPYVIVADDAFPLKTEMMKPYPGTNISHEKIIHNYRLSRARRVSENAFGILVARFEIYRQPIRASPDSVQKMVMATLALHNYLRTTSQLSYSPPELVDREDIEQRRFIPGQWRNYCNEGMFNLARVGQRPAHHALEVRDTFCHYFNNEGRVTWQNDMALQH